MATDPLSDMVQLLNADPAVARMRRAGYMSPQSAAFQGRGFACGDCDKFRKTASDEGDCLDPQIRASVERRACCNRFEYHGVHT